MSRPRPDRDDQPTYTRSPMETGTLGTTRPLSLDDLSSEAVQTIAGAAAQLHELAGLLRAGYENAITDASHGPAGATGSAELASGRQLLGRLDLAERAVRDAAALIEAGAQAVGGGSLETVSHRIALLAAQEEERARLANELHDGPAQGLANLIFQTEVIDRAIRMDAEAGDQELRSMRQMLQTELNTLRVYINQLRPPLIDSEGLDEALRDAANRLTEHDGIPVEIRLEASPALIEEPARAVALRVAQEALRNVSKHAGATRAWLFTRLEPPASQSKSSRNGSWLLEVGDDGRGFDMDTLSKSAVNKRHFGLRFMRERSSLLGAQLSIDTRPAAGTVVRLRIDTRGKGSPTG